MSNAIKYTKKGTITVEASVVSDKILMSVTDSGVGIEPSKIVELFTAFTKIQRNREMNSEGVGLGLTICKILA